MRNQSPREEVGRRRVARPRDLVNLKEDRAIKGLDPAKNVAHFGIYYGYLRYIQRLNSALHNNAVSSIQLCQDHAVSTVLDMDL
jgi:hypothetical protein